MRRVSLGTLPDPDFTLTVNGHTHSLILDPDTPLIYVCLAHEGGYRTYYVHLDGVSVHEGQRVEAGDPVLHVLPESWQKAETDGQRWRWLLDQMAKADPAQADVPQMMFAVDTRYADDATPIPPNADVACIPPVSGG